MEWPLWTVYPTMLAFNYCMYLAVLPRLCTRFLPGRYGSFSRFNRMCFRQNVLSALHTLLACALLGTVLVTDETIAKDRLGVNHSILLYAEIAASFGYFGFALPVAAHMNFVLGAGPPFTSPSMVVHHAMVATAQATFLLTGRPAWYMACSGVLFEATNVFYIPHVLLVQLRRTGTRLAAVNSALVFLAFSACRICLCTALAVASLSDLSSLVAPASDWAAVLTGLGCFYGLLLLSWWWYARDVLPALHRQLQSALGDTYHHRFVPAPARRWAWRNLSSEGRERSRELEHQARVLRELRDEMAAMAAEASAAEAQTELVAARQGEGESCPMRPR